MSEPYVPTTEQVRNNMALAADDEEMQRAARDVDWPLPGLRDGCKRQFDLWLAAHDREVAARTLRAAAEDDADDWLLARADRIEAGEVDV